VCILQVLALGQHIGGDEHPQLGFTGSQPAIGGGTEAAGQCDRIAHLVGQHGNVFHAGGAKLLVEVQRSVGKLREDEQLFIAVGS
jgi:hypothetical protein